MALFSLSMVCCSLAYRSGLSLDAGVLHFALGVYRLLRVVFALQPLKGPRTRANAEKLWLYRPLYRCLAGLRARQPLAVRFSQALKRGGKLYFLQIFLYGVEFVTSMKLFVFV